VSGWRIRVPFHSREETLDADALIDLPATFSDPDERRTTREILFGLWMDGAQTMGDALERLEQASPSQRRQLLDTARKSQALPTIREVQEAEAREAAKPRVVGYTRHGQAITFADRRSGIQDRPTPPIGFE
jgi:hypothetical protein